MSPHSQTAFHSGANEEPGVGLHLPPPPLAGSTLVQASPALPKCPCPDYSPRSPRECPVHYGMMTLRRTAESSLEIPESEALGLP